MSIAHVFRARPSRWLTSGAAAILAVTAGVLASVPAAMASAIPASCASSGAQPIDPAGGGWLYDVSVVSSCSAWAVGASRPGGPDERTLIERWNGHAWTIATSPSPKGFLVALNGVAATSAASVWAVGSYGGMKRNTTLIEHWNGRAWRRVASPSPGPASSLQAVAATARGDAWAVGEQSAAGATNTLTEHWNGRAWQQIASPSPANMNTSLTSVAIVSPSDVWAVGTTSGIGTGTGHAVIEHWNGRAWHLVKAPVLSSNNELWALTAVSASDVWAVGDLQTSTTSSGSLIEHWNGHSWHVVTSPSPGTLENSLHGVDAISANNIWAVGYTSSGYRQTLIEHWDGHSWLAVSSPNPGGPTNYNYLTGISGTSCSNMWAVGYFEVSAISTPTAAHC